MSGTKVWEHSFKVHGKIRAIYDQGCDLWHTCLDCPFPKCFKHEGMGRFDIEKMIKEIMYHGH